LGYRVSWFRVVDTGKVNACGRCQGGMKLKSCLVSKLQGGAFILHQAVLSSRV
jgi:hypothetical protein